MALINTCVLDENWGGLAGATKHGCRGRKDERELFKKEWLDKTAACPLEGQWYQQSLDQIPFSTAP